MIFASMAARFRIAWQTLRKAGCPGTFSQSFFDDGVRITLPVIGGFSVREL